MRKYQEDTLSRFEVARIIAARSIQIAMGAPILVDLSEEELRKVRYDPTEVAKIEFEKGVLPLIIVRKR